MRGRAVATWRAGGGRRPPTWTVPAWDTETRSGGEEKRGPWRDRPRRRCYPLRCGAIPLASFGFSPSFPRQLGRTVRFCLVRTSRWRVWFVYFSSGWCWTEARACWVADVLDFLLLKREKNIKRSRRTGSSRSLTLRRGASVKREISVFFKRFDCVNGLYQGQSRVLNSILPQKGRGL